MRDNASPAVSLASENGAHGEVETGSIDRVFFQAGELQQGATNKQRVIFKVPLPQPAWFAAESKEPLQSVALHPNRRLAGASGMEIKSGAHTEKEGGVELFPISSHKLLLF